MIPGPKRFKSQRFGALGVSQYLIDIRHLSGTDKVLNRKAELNGMPRHDVCSMLDRIS
jgi:hypothetical protein